MRYGLLKYHNTENLGDEVQSIAVRRFLPAVDIEIDRDRLASFEPVDEQRYKLVCNGWFSHCPTEWPPSKFIDPLLISVHISHSIFVSPARSSQGILPADIMLHDGVIEYLRHFGPVGTRDLATLDLLEKANVPAYFSGCVTLTLPKKGVEKRSDLIVVCDVPEEALKYIRSHTTKSVQIVRVLGRGSSSSERFAEAEEHLKLLKSASCVISSRLHVTLPCLALGTPVFMIDTAEDQYRFSGLGSLYRHGSLEAFLTGAVFDVENPTPNSVDYEPIARNIERTIKSFITTQDIRPSPDLTAARINAITVNLMNEARKNMELEGTVRMLQEKSGITPADRSEERRRDSSCNNDEVGEAARLRERTEELETEVARSYEELAQIRLIHGGLWTTHKQTTQQIESLKTELARRDEEVRNLRREMSQRDGTIRENRNLISKQQAQISNQESQISQQKAHISNQSERIERTLQEIWTSRSWRVTAPLRRFGKIFRGQKS